MTNEIIKRVTVQPLSISFAVNKLKLGR